MTERFVCTYKNPRFGTRAMDRDEPTWPELANDCTLLKVYELNDDGTLTEYVKPERMFAHKISDDEPMNPPSPQSKYIFSMKSWTYYEVMPNGDYRKIGPEERRELDIAS